MHVFEIVIALLLGGAGLAALARKIGTPYPALVALAGAALALLPGTPELVLNPELALALFVAPVLLDTAFDASPRDLRANWPPVAGLALGAVALTIISVAIAARWLQPEMPWAAAIALGAIVAPPDATAATAVLKQLRPPFRLLVILEGESLFNDASALFVYRIAVGAAIGTMTMGWQVLPMLLVVTAGSAALGLALAQVSVRTIGRIRDMATSVIVQFCTTFAVWMLAERLHLSGILTTVVYAMAASRTAANSMPARIRIPSYAVWEVAVFVLNVLAFILIGFQLKTIVTRLDSRTLIEYGWFALAACVATILARFAWVSGVAAVSRWYCKPHPDGRPGPMDRVGLSGRAAALVGWCGMRGIVTLAAALALPTAGDGVTPFPFRDLIFFTAFSVVLVTLVVQGMTLGPLLAWLRLEDDGTVEREVQLARGETRRAALAVIPPGTIEACAFDSERDLSVMRAALNAERRRLIDLRADGTIGDAAFQAVEQELDWEELHLQQSLEG